jgi:hypothetical protein
VTDKDLPSFVTPEVYKKDFPTDRSVSEAVKDLALFVTSVRTHQ